MNICYILYPIWILLDLWIFFKLFYTYIYTPHKLRTTRTTFNNLLVILNATINTEIELYEKDIFNTKGAITNSNFDNYYKDICEAIRMDLSPIYMRQMEVYITSNAVYTIIARRVKNYLTDKITGTI